MYVCVRRVCGGESERVTVPVTARESAMAVFRMERSGVCVRVCVLRELERSSIAAGFV